MVDIEIKPLKELPLVDIGSTEPFVVDANTYGSIGYEDFFNNHMRKYVPCIIRNIGTDWEASQKWASDDKIDYDYLLNQYGSLTVPVLDCNKMGVNCQPRSEMKFSDYISYWKGNTRDKMLYLKDWHLRRAKPDDKFYTVPKLFASDWLNEYAQDKHVDDLMFVYMGPSGTWTPLHADVYDSFSWSVNVAGRKKWFLLPPGEEQKLKDKFNNLPLRFDPEKNKDVTYYEIIQGKGDAIFVPTGWYHQVENEIDTISINHNWVNATNVVHLWENMNKVLAAVEKEIDDLKDLEEFPCLCQNMLKTLFGMDCEEFVTIIMHIGEKRLKQIENGGPNIAFNNYSLGRNHCLYDLKSIYETINLVTKHSPCIKNENIVTEKLIVLQDCLKHFQYYHL